MPRARLRNKRSHRNEKPTSSNEDPTQPKIFLKILKIKLILLKKNYLEFCHVNILCSFLQEVLKQLQGSIEDEAMASSGQIDLLERLKGRFIYLFIF